MSAGAPEGAGRAVADPAAVIAAARGWLGTPYHDQQSLKGVGCDCLGLARGVWREVVGPEPETLPPYSRDWGEVGAREVLTEGALRWMVPVALSRHAGDLAPGDLLVFRMRAGAIAKHVGILVAPDRFLHAYERLGVVEERLTPLWQRRIACVFAYPARES